MSTVVMAACWPLQGLSPAQKAVLISLADQSNDEGFCWPSVKTISIRTCLSERAVQLALRWLESAGFLKAKERSGTSTVYQITPASAAPLQEMHPRTKCTPPPQDMHPTPASAAPHPRISCTQTINEPSMNHQGTVKKGAKPSFRPPEWINAQHWDAWHSCAKRKKATDAQKQMAVDKLAEWRDQGLDFAGALENAAISGWQGLFLPDNSKDKHQGASETAYQRSMRLRMQEAVPSIAASAPAIAHTEFFRTIEQVEVLR